MVTVASSDEAIVSADAEKGVSSRISEDRVAQARSGDVIAGAAAEDVVGVEGDVVVFARFAVIGNVVNRDDQCRGAGGIVCGVDSAAAVEHVSPRRCQ